MPAPTARSADGDPSSISLVVVTWNSAGVVGECLSTFRREIGDRPHDIIVVDNGSHDDTVAVVEAAAPDATVVRNRVNRGLAAGNNQGIVAATSDYVLISNPDVRYRPGSIDALLLTAARHPRAAFVIPRTLHPDGALQPGAGDLPTFREALSGRSAANRKGATSGFYWDGWAHDEERTIGHGAECAYLVRREAIAAVGPQDERYVLDWEGKEWARRVWDNGWEVWFCPAGEVVHLTGDSLRQVPRRWITGSHRGMYLYFATGAGPVRRLGLAAVVGARLATKLAVASVDRRMYERTRPRTEA